MYDIHVLVKALIIVKYTNPKFMYRDHEYLWYFDNKYIESVQVIDKPVMMKYVLKCWKETNCGMVGTFWQEI